MNAKTKFINNIIGIWTKRHWLILAIIVILLALYELFEFITDPPSFLNDPLHLVELILEGVILPVVLLTLQRTKTQKDDAINTLSLVESFVYQLNRARNWDELIEIIVQFPRSIVPLTGIWLWIRASNSNQFDLESTRVFESTVKTAPHPESLNLANIQCYQAGINKISGIEVCNCPFQLQSQQTSALHKRYCLPLQNANSVVGLLHLYLPASYKLQDDQKRFLKNITPEIALSVNDAVLQRKGTLQEAALETERLRLASDLHDTLGQDLAYLRNKIDHLIQSHTLRDVAPRIKEGLNQMRTVAEQANQTIRNILAVTYSNQETVLDSRLLSYAKVISERAGFTISLGSQGESQTLNPHMQFQVFLIFREILANIEKHAKAHHVIISLNWTKEEMTLEISDDGRGFLMSHLDRNDHFGLTIIETRTREMNGNLSVESAPRKGTHISIRIPITHNELLLSN